MTGQDARGRPASFLHMPQLDTESPIDLTQTSKSTRIRRINLAELSLQILAGQLSSTSSKHHHITRNTNSGNGSGGSSSSSSSNNLSSIRKHSDEDEAQLDGDGYSEEEMLDDNDLADTHIIATTSANFGMLVNSTIERHTHDRFFTAQLSQHVYKRVTPVEAVEFIISLGLTINSWRRMRSLFQKKLDLYIFPSEKLIRQEMNRVSYDITSGDFTYEYNGNMIYACTLASYIHAHMYTVHTHSIRHTTHILSIHQDGMHVYVHAVPLDVYMIQSCRKNIHRIVQ